MAEDIFIQKDIWIFGDSFADSFWPKPVDFTPWPGRLDINYQTLNMAKIGTGPDYSLNLLIQLFAATPKQYLKKKTLIFFCSDPFRLNLKCYKDPMESARIYELAEGKVKSKATLFVKQLIDWYLDIEYRERCDLQYLSTLNHMSQYFKQVLYWPVPSLTPTIENFLDVADNMFVPNQALVDISIKDCGHQNIGVVDPRVNHLHKDNHDIMYDQLVNWIKNFSPIDTSKFKYVGPLETK